MIKLNFFDDADLADHLSVLRKFVLDRLGRLKSTRLKHADCRNTRYLNGLIRHLEGEVEQILIAQPAELRSIIAEIGRKFPKLEQVLAEKASARTLAQQDLVDGLKWVFDYDAFSTWTHAKWNAYALVDLHKLRVCPYCHAAHLNFHVRSFKDMRPPLDHFYPRSRYPYLGTSFYNLIPSCHQCNSSVKGSRNPIDKNLIHPYEIDESHIRFRLKSAKPVDKPLKPDDIEICIDVSSSSGADLSVEFFALRGRYQWYKHEVAEVHDRLLSQRDKTGTLGRLVGVKRYVYGFSENKSRERVLGRCIKDIVADLERRIP